jgi:asparagine synthase (glutamine-hydrolysing)
MAHGLEGRVPFLDNDLVDFAMRMPVSQKLGNLGKVAKLDENTPGSKPSTFFEKTSDGKLLLRQVMSRYVPDTVANAVKQGFSAPDATWFRGDSIDYVKRVLFDRKAAIYDVLDRAAVLGLVQEHLDGKHNRRLLVWSLLYLETFLKTFMTGSSVGERFHG